MLRLPPDKASFDLAGSQWTVSLIPFGKIEEFEDRRAEIHFRYKQLPSEPTDEETARRQRVVVRDLQSLWREVCRWGLASWTATALPRDAVKESWEGQEHELLSVPCVEALGRLQTEYDFGEDGGRLKVALTQALAQEVLARNRLDAEDVLGFK